MSTFNLTAQSNLFKINYYKKSDNVYNSSTVLLGTMKKRYDFGGKQKFVAIPLNFAGGIGSALSDLIGGYFVYVPITLVIKGLVALVSGLIYQKMCRYGKNRYVAVILGGITDIVFVAGGYFICEFFLYGSGAAASIPANIIQGVGGLIISAVLYPVLIAIPDVRQAAYETKN